MALLALVVASAGFVLSLLTLVHSRRRDFPKARLVIEWTVDDNAPVAFVENKGPGTATRITSSVWTRDRRWKDQGAWATDMQPGDRLSGIRLTQHFSGFKYRVQWYDEARPDKQRTATRVLK